MKKFKSAVLATLLTTGFTVAAQDSSNVGVEAEHDHRTMLSVGVAGFDSSSAFRGQSLEFETTFFEFPELEAFSGRFSFYAGGQYLSGTRKKQSNVKVKQSEVFAGIRYSLGKGSWMFVEEGYIEHSRQTANMHLSDSATTLRFGIEQEVLSEWIDSDDGSGIIIRASAEKYQRFEDDYEGYRLDIGFKSRLSFYFEDSFSGEERVYGFNYTHLF